MHKNCCIREVIKLFTIIRIGPGEVPADVWKSCHKKWLAGLRIGWHGDLWSTCALCVFCLEEFLPGMKECLPYDEAKELRHCDVCPLPPTQFCSQIGASSKLSIGYAEYSVDIDGLVTPTTERQWRRSI